jgi:GNAT superfamily N-acetyltransferase
VKNTQNMSATSLIQREDDIVIANTQPEHAEQLEALQVTVFPELDANERFIAAHYRRHLELFAEGQFVALAGDQVVGMTTTIRMDFDFEHADHSFDEVMAGGWLSTHQPDGDWLYGMDVGVHPDYRRRGIARDLYRARHNLTEQLGLKGQVTVGMMNGYGAVAGKMTPEEYFEQLKAGSISDPTVSAQMKVGFQPRALVKNYLNDPTCGNCGVLIVLSRDEDFC